MHKLIAWLVLLAAVAGQTQAAERKFDFSSVPLNESPTGCVSIVAGTGKPGTWKVISDEVPMAMPLPGSAPVITTKSVVAQLATDYTDEHFPMLILTNESYGDFTLTTRFKTVTGAIEQMAGMAFRLQDESNFYIVRASTLGKSFKWYKVVNGQRGPLIGAEDVTVPAGVWHDLSIKCEGNRIDCLLDGKQLIPTITDNDFSSGRIAYWTKSDSVSHFTDTQIVYTRREPLMQTWVRETMARYSNLLGLQILMPPSKGAEPIVVASNQPSDLNQPGKKNDADVVGNGTVYFDLQPDCVVVVMPLRDRNGEPRASVRMKMTSFKGQTEKTAIERANPILKQLQARIPASDDWMN